MTQPLYTTFLEGCRVYSLAKAHWKRFFGQLLTPRQFTFHSFLNEKRMDGNPLLSAYIPEVDRAVRIIQADPADAVSALDIKAWVGETVLPDRVDKVYELVIDLVLTTEAEQLGQWLIEEWVVKRLSREDMERVIGELLVVNEGLG
ncbi:MAG: hypothetical protein ACKV1O_13050 [Saprospiraceae bacterium]